MTLLGLLIPTVFTVTVAALGGETAPFFSPDTSTISFWRIDQTGGEVVCNQIDEGMKGQLVGGAKWLEDDSGKGIDFDGQEAKVVIKGGSDTFIESGEPFTIEILVRPRNSGWTGQIWESVGHVALEMRTDGVVWFNATDRAAKKLLDVRGKRRIVDGQCHRVAAMRDTVKNQLALYIDWQLDASVPCPASAEFLIPGWACMGGRVGRSGAKGEHYNGVIYGVHVSQAMRLGQPPSRPNPEPALEVNTRDRKAIEVVKDGKSAYCIYYAPDAPSSVRTAAKDLQRIIGVSTAALLPIRNAPVSPMICLGGNPESLRAGVDASKLLEEGFTIVLKGPDLFIAGKDTPDGQKTPNSGFSQGTAFGVYAFIENVIGVRWLLPGKWGEEIPRYCSLRVPQLSLSESPDFLYRRLLYVHNERNEVVRWSLRQKLGGSMQVNAYHSWNLYPSEEVFRQHPEYLPLIGVERTARDKDLYGELKFCTTNPGLVKAFAEGVIEWLDKHPDQMMASIAPSDGGFWCECAECRKLDLLASDHKGEWKDFGGYTYSHTLRILTFYNEVAKIVAQKHPGRLLGGLVYASYTYPLYEPLKVEPNVYLELAARPYYGMNLYKRKYAREFPRLVAGWTSVTPNFGYTDYSTWMRDNYGAPLPPCLPILKNIFPNCRKVGAKGMHYTGSMAWGYGAIHNYIVAKLMWNAQSDIDGLYREWLDLAYGPAAKEMREMYDLLEASMSDYKRNRASNDYDVLYDLCEAVYSPIFPDMERLYLQALGKVKTEAQRKRLGMFGDNLIMLHWNLRQAELLREPEKSFFHRSDETYQQWLTENRKSIALVDLDWLANVPGEELVLKAPKQRRAKSAAPALTIPKLSAGLLSPKIDGDLSDECWKAAAVAEGFKLIRSDQPAHQPTVCRALYDDKTLYLAFVCHEDRLDKLVRTTGARDDMRIYADDIVEVFLVTDADDLKHYWHLTLSAANVQWDGVIADPKANLAWQSATTVGDGRWFAEIAIPFKSLKVSLPAGRTWRANVAREEQPHRECSSWSPVLDGFCEPHSFGEWRFQ